MEVALVGVTLTRVLEPVFKPLVDLASSLAQKEIAKVLGIDEVLDRVSRNFRLNKSVLEDAEQKQFDNKHVGDWLEQFRDAAYDAEDVLDKLATEDAIQSKRREEEEGICIEQVCTPQNSSLSCFTRICFNHEMADAIKKVDRKLKHLGKQRENLGLQSIGSRVQNEVLMDRRTTSTPEEDFFGRDEEKYDCMKKLGLVSSIDEPGTSSQRARDRNVSLIPIVGMGGMGKTALVQEVYNDWRVQDHFSLKRWICVSDTFDASKLIAEIIVDDEWQRTLQEKWTLEKLQKLSLEDIQKKLKDIIRNAKFLIVLDDVWCEDPTKWQSLWNPLSQGGEGSKVIVTTRSGEVANAVYPTTPNVLKELPYKHCWSIFERRAFEDGNSNKYPSLKGIGEEIVKKMKGVPLAAKLVGGFLCTKLEGGFWQSVLDSDIWKFIEDENSILPVLRLSYHHLPSHLKRCFAYCSIFPKDCKFYIPRLVGLWMAQGFIESRGNMRMEEIGYLYFNELLQRSFFQFQGEGGSYVMHDLIHDLAESISKEECLRLGEIQSGNIKPEKVRHLSFEDTEENHFKKTKYQKSRTFLNLSVFRGHSSKLGDSVNSGHRLWCPSRLWDSVNSGFKYARVLIIRVSSTKLPDCIGDLIHLRYLHVEGTKRLPESVCRLHNLQTLIVDGGTKLPEGISRLVNLRHLEAYEGEVARISRIGRLSYLQELKMFEVGRREGRSRIGELQNLKQLSVLWVVNLENIKNKEEAGQAKLKEKVHLRDLALVWNFRWRLYDIKRLLRELSSVKFRSHRSGMQYYLSQLADEVGVGNEWLDGEVLEGLEPPPNITRLHILGNCGVRPPSWMQQLPFASGALTELHMWACLNWEQLTVSALGQLPRLEFLTLGRMMKIKRVEWELYSHGGGGEQEGNGTTSSAVLFPALQVLEFFDMPEWEEWVDVPTPGHRAFPSLRHLLLHWCPKLRMLPLITIPPSLESLSIQKCSVLQSLPNLSPPPDNGLPPSLRELIIRNCEGLQSLPNDLHNLSALQYLEIEWCPQMEALPDNGLPPSLRVLSIWHCEGLQSLPNDLHNLSALDTLSISGSPKMEALPDNGLPPSLRMLTIVNCEGLRSLPNNLHNLSALEYLVICGCPQMEALPDNGLPPSLRELRISDCEGLQSLPNHLHTVSALDRLEIYKCPQVRALPDNGLPPSLRELTIKACEGLQSLPNNLHNLSALEYLEIDECPQMQALPDNCLPTSLRDLRIRGCNALQSLPNDLHNLSALEVLHIDECPQMQALPDNGLPPSLQQLRISFCGDLQSLPDGLHTLSALQGLAIRDCPRVRALPDNGLPASLRLLHIRGCPALRKRCRRGGRDRPKIAHVVLAQVFP